jgi:hypothetical protein
MLHKCFHKSHITDGAPALARALLLRLQNIIHDVIKANFVPFTIHSTTYVEFYYFPLIYIGPSITPYDDVLSFDPYRLWITAS